MSLLYDLIFGPPAGSPDALANEAVDRMADKPRSLSEGNVKRRLKKDFQNKMESGASVATLIKAAQAQREPTGDDYDMDAIVALNRDGTRVPSDAVNASPLGSQGSSLSQLLRGRGSSLPGIPGFGGAVEPPFTPRGSFVGAWTDAQARANNVGGPGRDIYGNLSVVADRLNAQREQMEGERLSKRLAENSRIRRIQDELDASNNADLRKILLAGDLSRQNKQLEVGAQDRQTQATATYNQIKAALDARDLDRKIRRDQADVGIADRAQTTAERGQSLSEMEFATKAEKEAAERDPLSEYNLNKVRENIAGVLGKIAEDQYGQIDPARAEQFSDLMMAMHIAQSGTGAVYDPNTNMPIEKETIQALAKERGKTYEQMYKELTVRALQGIGDKFDG